VNSNSSMAASTSTTVRPPKFASSTKSSPSWLDRLQKEAHSSELDYTNTQPHTFLGLSALVVATAFVICRFGVPRNDAPLVTVMAIMGFVSHWIGFVLSTLVFRTNKYFDIIEDLSLFAMFYWSYRSINTTNNNQQQGPSLRQKLAHVCAFLWAVRLVAFVGYRVIIRGHDFRFDKLSKDVSYSFFAWTCGGLWCWLSGFSLWHLASNTESSTSMNGLDYFALTLFVVSLCIETVADLQKYKFNASHRSGTNPRWIDTGLWSVSRHPNYCAEIMVWTALSLLTVGDATMADAVMLLVPPVWSFVFLLFTSLMLLEKRADQKWGTNTEYIKYKGSTPVLFPGS